MLMAIAMAMGYHFGVQRSNLGKIPMWLMVYVNCTKMIYY
jgi:hypothetical protein